MKQDQAMKVLVTGGTGFVGRALVPRLLAAGHRVVVRTRGPDRAKNALGADVEIVDSADSWSTALDGVDAVINLAGEPIVSGRWTASKKRALVDSRVGLTEGLVEAIAAASNPPRVLVSGSAVGFYGDRGAETLTEESRRGEGFLADLCVDWERAAMAAEDHGVRVVTIRTGVVLGREGGALGKMLTPFKMGVGGRLGSGEQYMPWIHIADLVELLHTSMVDDRYRGPINGTGPEPVDNSAFTKALGRALGRPTIFPVPSFVLRAGFGEASAVLLTGQRAVPRRASEHGFTFQFSTVEEALEDVLTEDGLSFSAATNPPSSAYLDNRPVHRVLEQITWIDAPLDTVYDFFSKPANLGAMTPQTMSFDIQTPGVITMSPGAEIDYKIKLGPIPMNWRTRIESVEPGVSFVDTQMKGPYASWFHEHRFEDHGARTKMIDRVHYAAPFGFLGRIAERLVVEPQLLRIFGYRQQITALRFRRDDEAVAAAA